MSTSCRTTAPGAPTAAVAVIPSQIWTGQSQILIWPRIRESWTICCCWRSPQSLIVITLPQSRQTSSPSWGSWSRSGCWSCAMSNVSRSRSSRWPLTSWTDSCASAISAGNSCSCWERHACWWPPRSDSVIHCPWICCARTQIARSPRNRSRWGHKRILDWGNYEEGVENDSNWNFLGIPFLQSWELLLLASLQWNVSAITGFDYVDHILRRVPWGTENPHIRTHAHTLVSVCLTGKNLVAYDFILFPWDLFESNLFVYSLAYSSWVVI